MMARRKPIPHEQVFNPMSNSPAQLAEANVELMYRQHMMSWAMRRFKWTVPDNINPRIIEWNILRNGMCLFYKDPRFDKFMAVAACSDSLLNVFQDPTMFRTTDAPGYVGLRVGNSRYATTGVVGVPIFGNDMRNSELMTINTYAARLAQTDTTLRVNTLNLRNTRIVMVPESQKLSVFNVLRQHQEGNPAVVGSTDLDESAFKSLDLAVPHSLAQVRDERNALMNEFMTLMGIDNANTDKAERVVVGEVNANNGQVFTARNALLAVRQEACDEINRVWGLDVKVEWATDLIEADRNEMMGGDGDGRVHNGTEDDDRVFS